MLKLQHRQRLYCLPKTEVDVDPSTPLLWVLRDHLDLTGTKYGCGIARCGACTVHIDGQAVRSCVYPASAAKGKAITTIEGLSEDGSHPVQQAWVELDTPQCGYCQPGMIMASAALLAETPTPVMTTSTSSITNICRCGTLPRVREGIHRAPKIAGRTGQGGEHERRTVFISRRRFLVGSATAGAGLMVAMRLPLAVRIGAGGRRRPRRSTPGSLSTRRHGHHPYRPLRDGAGHAHGSRPDGGGGARVRLGQGHLGVPDARRRAWPGTALGQFLHRRQSRHPRQPPVRARGRRPGRGRC
jgi:isoquinoline 1-oxidoreductase alpha subunit